MEKNKLGQEPVFACQITLINGETIDSSSMSKRFYAACAAMQGLIQCGAFNVYEDLEKCIEYSYQFAEELLKQENL